MKKRKSCPFCNSLAQVVSAYGDKEGCYHVFCECGASGPFSSTREGAVEKWNVMPRNLQWSEDKPRMPGYYWYRSKGVPFVTLVKEGDFKCGPALYDAWAGPIPEPMEQE